MECAVDHRPPRRNRSGAGPVRPLFLVPWLARRGETHTAIPIAVRSVFDAGAAHHGLVFFIVAALFCVQTLLGGATAHYHADTGGFFGYDLASVLPEPRANGTFNSDCSGWSPPSWLRGSISRR